MPALPLVTTTQLEGRINAVNTGDLDNVLYATLSSTTTQLKEILLHGEFSQGADVVEDFYIPERIQINNQRFIDFKLNNGFIDQSTSTVKLQLAFTQEDLANGTEIDSQYLKIDEEKGYVTLDTIQLDSNLFSVYNTTRRIDYWEGYLFRITYDHGLSEKGTAQGKVYNNVPDWLQECAMIKGREIYQYTVPSKDKTPKDFSANLAAIADRHVRFRPYAIEAMVR